MTVKELTTDDLNVGNLYTEREISEVFESEDSSWNITDVGPNVLGVNTKVIQGGSDQCYIFVWKVYNPTKYELVYAY